MSVLGDLIWNYLLGGSSPSPGTSPTGTISITENGTYNVAEFAEAEVEVAGGNPNENLEKVNNNTLTSISSNMTGVKQYLFAGCTNLTQVNLPNLASIQTYGFYKCGFSAFVCENYLTLGPNAFRECPNLETVVFKGGATRFDTSLFERCNALQAVDCASLGVNGINGGAFYNTPSIAALILRQTNKVVYLSQPLPASGALTTTGFIYVPASLVDTYKAATNWSVIADRIVAIEGTQYETHYANGEAIV